MRFEWDPKKSRGNEKKHGLSFSEAKTLFESGVDYLEIYDEDHSADEDRFIAIGPVEGGLIVVAWTEKPVDPHHQRQMGNATRTATVSRIPEMNA